MTSSFLVIVSMEVLAFIIAALSIVIFVLNKRTKKIKMLAGACQLTMEKNNQEKERLQKELEIAEKKLRDTLNAPVDDSKIKEATKEYLKKSVEETLNAYKKAHGTGKVPIKNFQGQKSPVQKALSLRYLVITGEISVMKEEDMSKACMDAVGELITVFKK